jgi:hypothetical protein
MVPGTKAPARGIQKKRPARQAGPGVAKYMAARKARSARAASAADRAAAQQSAAFDPCEGLTGRDALDCRAASAQVDLGNETKVRF